MKTKLNKLGIINLISSYLIFVCAGIIMFLLQKHKLQTAFFIGSSVPYGAYLYCFLCKRKLFSRKKLLLFFNYVFVFMHLVLAYYSIFDKTNLIGFVTGILSIILFLLAIKKTYP